MARNAERWKNHIRRASILQDPLLGGSISREHGNRYSVDAAARTYVQGWEVAEILQCERSPINHEPSIAHPRRLSEAHNSSTLAMRAFDFDPGTRSLFYRTLPLFSYLTLLISAIASLCNSAHICSSTNVDQRCSEGRGNAL